MEPEGRVSARRLVALLILGAALAAAAAASAPVGGPYRSEFKRLPEYTFGLGKRRWPPAAGATPYDDGDPSDPGWLLPYKRAAGPQHQQQQLQLQQGALKDYVFGLGKRLAGSGSNYQFGVGKRDRLYLDGGGGGDAYDEDSYEDIGGGGGGSSGGSYYYQYPKRRQLGGNSYTFGMGKRSRLDDLAGSKASKDKYSFGIGKRLGASAAAGRLGQLLLDDLDPSASASTSAAQGGHQ